MDRQRISVDDLLARQTMLRAGIRATIKADADGRVKVTPVVAGGACACAHEITVNKADIEDLALTDDVSECCGEKLLVVEIAFANETVASIFRQLSRTAAQSFTNSPVRALSHGRRPAYSLPRPAWDMHNYRLCYEQCLQNPASQLDLELCVGRCALYHLSSD